MVMSGFRPEVEIWPFRACAMHAAIIIGTVRSLWTWLWGGILPCSTECISSLNSVLQSNTVSCKRTFSDS